METKRCPNCHKLQRADTQVCSRCGYTFLNKKAGTRNRNANRPSNPPASPHRAGHYAGLHPEDQPYQSSKIAVQRPSTVQGNEWRRPAHEPEHIVLPFVDEEEEETLPVASPRGLGNLQQPKQPIPPLFPEKRGFATFVARPFSVLLALACLFFLLASSIIAFALIGKSSSAPSAAIFASPDVVRANDAFILSGRGFTDHHWLTFAYDFRHTILDENQKPLQIQVGEDGSFSLAIRALTTWGIGKHTIYAIDVAQQSSVSTTITIEQTPADQPHLQLTNDSVLRTIDLLQKARESRHLFAVLL